MPNIIFNKFAPRKDIASLNKSDIDINKSV